MNPAPWPRPEFIGKKAFRHQVTIRLLPKRDCNVSLSQRHLRSFEAGIFPTRDSSLLLSAS
jgi:hypothetical protein